MRIIGKTIRDHLEDWIGTQGVMVVLVLVVGEDAIDSLSHHAQQRMPSKKLVSTVLKRCSELFGKPDMVIKLPDGQEAAVARERRWRNLDVNRPRR